VLQILNQIVDLMLRIVGHVSRDRYLHSTLGDNTIDVPNANFGGRVPLSPAGITPLGVR